MNSLYLVRHGENPANVTREFSCRNVDYSLTPRGRLQAQQTARLLSRRRIDEIYSSPLKRAVETAQIIADELSLPVVVMEQFREINVGLLESKPPTDENWRFYNTIMEVWRSGRHEVAFPGGENYLTLLERMRDGLTQAIADKFGRNIVVVGHGGIFAATIRDLCRNENIDDLLQADNPNCSITELTLRMRGSLPEGYLETWAACEHLSGDAARHAPAAHVVDHAEKYIANT